MICLAGCCLEEDIRKACVGDVEAQRVDIVQVGCVLLLRSYEFARVVDLEHELARTPSPIMFACEHSKTDSIVGSFDFLDRMSTSFGRLKQCVL